MTVTALNIPTLKAVKNAVIGNRTAKGHYGRDEMFVSRLVECINDPPASPGEPEGYKTSLRIEAAHILTSLSYGSADALRTLLRLNACQALLYAISTFQPSDSVPLKAALTRALRALATAFADTVGPSQWGLSPTVSDLRPEAKVALDCFFQILDVYIPLLIDPSPQVSTTVAQLIASAVRDPAHRTKVSDWCPPGERIIETKGKRGWEKRDPTKSPSRQGCWIARTLTALLRQKDVKLQEATLAALASLTKENEGLALRLARAQPGQEPALSSVLSLCKSRNTDLQLAASLCATNILRAPSTPKIHMPYIPSGEQTTAIAVMHVLNRIISSNSASHASKTKACFILYHLVTDHRLFCQLAYERNCLAQVAQLATSITPLEKTVEIDEDEPESMSRLREAALTAVAAIAMFDNDIRTAVTDEFKIIPAVQASLSHQYVGVRYAACQCARALSRAVAALRTNIVDTGLGMSVFQLFMKQGENRQVMHAASTVVCNVVTDFSPLRSTLIEQGVITRLVELLNTGDSALRLNALWAFKNLLYKATPDLKRQVMNRIGWQEVRNLFEDPDHRIREQTFHIVRHVADGVDGADLQFSDIGGSEVLLDHLAKVIESDDDEDVVLQAVFVLANMANSASHQRSILANPGVLKCLRDCLIDAKVEIRRPAISCVLELVRQNPRSHRELHEAKIDSTLRHMCEHASHVSASPTTLRLTGGRQMGAEDDVEVQDKARQALHWLEHNADMDM